ncbi:MAG: trans-4-hydroxy-L-proline dehydratase activase [Bacillota bacterium]|nr:glycyl-radical enzyme activating protein [Bacillota bacterium]MDD3297940.1 glycyl-radical enzyme activating protein [Bacillota bacterium]MDD3850598.1 glycyl-radical enzyme activating protein [Bacillota bacterium]MDD4707386.1 glycyl-radical enzyme activating protein [Bacillota bacterium]
MATGTIFNIQKYSIHDGPGIRTTVFLKGCPLSCWWCHNPESQRYGPQLVLWKERCIGCGDCTKACPEDAILPENTPPIIDEDKCSCCGACARVCPATALEIIGKAVTSEYVMKEIEKDLIFYDQSGGGVAFSGGEPLMQPEFLKSLLKECKKRDIHTVVDTSGYANWEILSAVSGITDLFLYDIKHMDDAVHTKTVGVSNRVILENLRKLAWIHNNINIRIPLVPGINDDQTNIHETAQFISSINIKDVNILPYHRTGIDKYGRLGREYRVADVREPSKEYVESIGKVFVGYGLSVKIGG